MTHLAPEEASTSTAVGPAYLRIASALRDRIASGDLVPNQMLPPERDLCGEYGVSRMTARRALSVLQSEGLVYRSATRGTFIAEPRVELRLGSFSQEISRTGRQPAAEVFWAIEQPASPQVAHALSLDAENAVVALQRLRRSNDEALALETTYYPAALVPGLLDGDLTGSLWCQLRNRYGINIARTTARLEVVVLDPVVSEQLETKVTAAGLQLTRQSYDEAGRCIEYALDVYRADRVSLIIERSITDL